MEGDRFESDSTEWNSTTPAKTSAASRAYFSLARAKRLETAGDSDG